MQLVNAYNDDRYLYLVSPDHSIQRVAAEWSIYLHSKRTTQRQAQFINSYGGLKDVIEEGDWRRCVCKSRDARQKIVELECPTYEGDVYPARRYLTDNPQVSIARPKRCYLDIETDSRVPFIRKEEARVLSWALYDNRQKVATGLLEDDSDWAEEDVLAALYRELQPFDQVLAWNGDNFDFPVIFARGPQFDHRRWLWLDQLKLYKRMNVASESGDEKQSMRLGDVGTALLGEGKDNFDSSKTWDAWAAGGAARERLLRYNEKDVDLQRRIEEKTGFAALFDTLADACLVFPDSRGLYPTNQVDGFLLRLGLARGVHFKTREFIDDAPKFAGAYVMQPRGEGIQRNVHVADFASLYPSIMMTWNMSPETKTDESGPDTCEAPGNKQRFRTDVEGILPVALTELIKLRKEWNEKKTAAVPGTDPWKEADRRSTAYKVAANSFYGVIGSPYSRFYDPEIGLATTSTGAWLIKKTIEVAETRGMRVVYGDTDSCFIAGASREEFGTLVNDCNRDVYPSALTELGCKQNYIKLAYEKEFAHIVFTGAKRYAGLYAHYKGKEATADSKPEIRGLEYRRGDTAVLARRLQEKVINLVLAGEESMQRYEQIVQAYLDKVREGSLSIEEVRITKSIRRELEEYSQRTKLDGTPFGQPAHVSIAKAMLAAGEEVTIGMRIAYVVSDGAKAPIKTINSTEYDGRNADRAYLWEHLVWPPTKRFLEAAFPRHPWRKWDRIRTKVPKEQLRLC